MMSAHVPAKPDTLAIHVEMALQRFKVLLAGEMDDEQADTAYRITYLKVISIKYFSFFSQVKLNNLTRFDGIGPATPLFASVCKIIHPSFTITGQFTALKTTFANVCANYN